MMQSPFAFNFQAPQQGMQQQGSNPLQQILAMRQQQGAQPMQGAQPPNMSQPQMSQQKSQAPLDFMQLAGVMGYQPDPKASMLDQQSGAIGHIMSTLSGPPLQQKSSDGPPPMAQTSDASQPQQQPQQQSKPPIDLASLGGLAAMFL